MREPLRQAIIGGAGEVAVPTFLSTLCICIVFVPVFLLQGTAKYLFSPLSLSVIGALLASLALSFTMVPVMFDHLMRRAVARVRGGRPGRGARPGCQERAGALPGRIRGGLRPLPRGLPQHARLGGVEVAPDRHGLCRARGRLRAAVPVPRAGLLPAGGCRADAPARARPARNATGGDAALLRPGGDRRSASSSGTRRSMSCWTTSACPTAASTSPSVTPRPWVRWTGRS